MNQSTDQPIRRSARPRNAFTLIELLVVVAILALLMSILSPSIRQAKVLTQRTQCLARQRAIGQGLSQYASDNVGIYPNTLLTGVDWSDAYGLRDDYPYTGARDRAPLGVGLLVSGGMLPSTGLGDVIHCPSLHNFAAGYQGHCMDVAHPWGYGGSGWNQYPNHRIIGGFNYRGTSYQRINGEPPRMYKEGGNFVILTDVLGWRFRGERGVYNAHGGFNCVFADGGGSFLADPEYMVDDLLAEAGGRGDGRGGSPWGSNDEKVFKHMAAERER